MHYCFHRSASSTTLTAVLQTLRRGASWLTRDARLALNWWTVKTSWIICCIGVLVINPSPKWIESVPIRGSKDMSSKFAGLQLFCQACRKESATQEGPKKKKKQNVWLVDTFSYIPCICHGELRQGAMLQRNPAPDKNITQAKNRKKVNGR